MSRFSLTSTRFFSSLLSFLVRNVSSSRVNILDFLLVLYRCYWQLSQVASRPQAIGSSLCKTIREEADSLFIQRGCKPLLLLSVVDFSICVAPSALR